MSKNNSLKLFTKTWSPDRVIAKNNVDKDRPLTATLEKPTVLDINLIGKIDMSTIRKEFLNISNLCRLPLILKSKKMKGVISRPATVKFKKTKRSETSEDSLDEENISVKSARKSKVPRPNNRLKQLDAISKQSSIKKSVSDPNNNKSSDGKNVVDIKILKLPRKNLNDDVNVSSKFLSQPCTTCGRANQPERFHSHPATPLKVGKKVEEVQKIPVKSSVQKPIAMKYKSKNNPDKQPISNVKKPSLPSQKLLHTPPKTACKEESPKTTRAWSAKKLLTCNICGREFGTASLPLHEPKCLEKWERENPNTVNLRPTFLDNSHNALTQDYPNKQTENDIQTTLQPCDNCGRTFFPERLLVHQRSCKTPQPKKKSTEQLAPFVGNTTDYTSTDSNCLCDQIYQPNSLSVHEENCLKKWTEENTKVEPELTIDQKTIPSVSKQELLRIPSAKRPPLFPCYLCGKLFTVNSIYIHERQCLKMWKVENEKLPPHKRRPHPLKPDIRFTDDGKIDYAATSEANWQSHLSQLVPCTHCMRTFNPDRVDTHEKSCKG